MKHTGFLAAAGVALCALTAGAPAMAQECYLGQVKMFAGNFAPRNYALAEGQLLPISQFEALFALLGTTYGGDGRTSFALPDLRGRVPVGAGAGPGLNQIQLGTRSGDEYTQPRAGQAAAGTGVAVATPDLISNMQPYTGIHYLVCINGLFPSRS